MSDLDLNGVKWPEIAREDWEQKLKKELKTEDLDNLKIELERGIVYDPLKSHTPSEKQSITHFPKISYGQNFDFSDDASLNECLLSLLQNDLRVVSLKAKNIQHWSVVLQEVFTNYIHFDIEFDSKYQMQQFESFQKSSQHKTWSVSHNMNHSPIHRLDYSSYAGLSQLELIQNAILDSENSNTTKVKVKYAVGENLLKIIPFSRALRIAFENRFPDKELIVEAVCDLSEISNDKNDELIKAGSVYMFCSMAGINHVYFHSLKSKADLNHARLLLNVQNIVSLESKTDEIKDPLKGSLIIDDLTGQFLSNYCNSFK